MYNPATVDLATYGLLQYTEESGVNSIGASVIFERNLLEGINFVINSTQVEIREEPTSWLPLCLHVRQS